MSVATELEALRQDKIAIASAITAKGGTVNSGDGFDDFAADIGTIFTGYYTESQIVSLQYKFFDTDFTGGKTEIEVTVPYVNRQSLIFTNAFGNTKGLAKIKINADFSPTTIYSLVNCYDYGKNNLTEVCLNFPTGDCTNFDRAFQSATATNIPFKVTGIPLDFSSCTATTITNFLHWSNSCTDIRFAASTLGSNLSLETCYALCDDCLVSVANSLRTDVTGKTLKFHSVKKTRCSALMGTIADGVFTQDDEGTTTLASFITDTKGWTLA